MGPTVFGWLLGVLETILPSIRVVDVELHGDVGKVVAKACPTLEASARAGPAVSNVENRNDTQWGTGAAGADGGSPELALALGPAGRR